jgi:thiol-disulfide isomerase/thioredoxin
MAMARIIKKRLLCLGAGAVLWAAAWSASADEKFAVLHVGSEVYSNVTITDVTTTDIYFTHSRGVGNAKLKSLDPDLQRHFGFDPKKAGAAEKKQKDENLLFRAKVLTPKAALPPKPDLDEDGNVVVPKLYAHSFLGQHPPKIIVDEWLTPPPDISGKFVLVVLWSTWAQPCRDVIPHLNDLYSKFKDRLAIIALSSESLEDMRKMTQSRMDFSVGTDTQGRTWNAFGLEGIPHAVLIDPQGFVRFEGGPPYLTEKGLQSLIDRFSN